MSIRAETKQLKIDDRHLSKLHLAHKPRFVAAF